MRFKNVLSYDKNNGYLLFNFKNFFAMRNIRSEDIDHLGKTIKYWVLGTDGIINYRIPFTDLNFLIDKNTGKSEIVKYNVSDFTIGMCIVIPIGIFVTWVLYKLPFKMYFVLGFVGFVSFYKQI